MTIEKQLNEIAEQELTGMVQSCWMPQLNGNQVSQLRNSFQRACLEAFELGKGDRLLHSLN